MAKKAYIGVENFVPRDLPNGYTQVEYIESTGTQYINTGFKANQNSRIVFDFMLYDYSNARPMFGARDGAGKNAFCLFANQNKTYQRDYASVQSANLGTVKFERTIVELNKNQFIVGDSVLDTASASTFSGSYPVFLFAVNNGGSLHSSGVTSGQLYSCQIYDNGTLVRDYIPCVNDSGAAGLYDLVNGAFYTNAGTGAFTAGQPLHSMARRIIRGYVGVENFVKRSLPSGYTQVEYIQSSGTQYIDTGFKHNQNTRVVMKAQVTKQPSTHAWLFEGRTTTGTAHKSLFLLNGSAWNADYVSGASGQRYAFTSLSVLDLLEVDYNKNSLTVNGETKTWTAATFQSTVNLALLACNTGGTISGHVSAKLYSCQIYDNGTLVRDYVPCKNASGTVGLYDMANGSFYTNAGSGAFTAGATYSGVARKIKKAYIGIGGVARLCYVGNQKITKHGAISSLTVPSGVGNTPSAMYNQSGETDSYAIIFTGASYPNVYDKNLTRTLMTSLPGTASARAGKYLVVAGNGAIDDSLTVTSVPSYPVSVSGLCGGSTGNNAVFGGGRTWGTYDTTSRYVAYSESLTQTLLTGPSVEEAAGGSFRNHAVFGGGIYEDDTDSEGVCTFDSSLTRTYRASLSNKREYHAFAASRTHAIFAAGRTAWSDGTEDWYKNTEAYNQHFTKTFGPDLPAAKLFVFGESFGDFAVFMGGYTQSSMAGTKTANSIDDSLTLATLSSMSTGRYAAPTALVGDYMVIAGGISNGSGNITAVEAYKLTDA